MGYYASRDGASLNCASARDLQLPFTAAICAFIRPPNIVKVKIV